MIIVLLLAIIALFVWDALLQITFKKELKDLARRVASANYEIDLVRSRLIELEKFVRDLKDEVRIGKDDIDTIKTTVAKDNVEAEVRSTIPVGKTVAQYTERAKRDCVKAFLADNVSLRQSARKQHIPYATLRHWVKLYRADEEN